MSHQRYPRLLLGAANLLLVAGFIVPWVMLTSMPAGEPIMQAVSPAIILWNTLLSVHGAAQGSPLTVWSLIYLAAAGELAVLSILIIRGAVSNDRRIALALAALPGAFISLFLGLCSAPLLYFGLTLDTMYSDATLGLGIPLAFVGAVLALISLTKLSK